MVPRGRLDFLARKYCWVPFPGTPHFFISLFTPLAPPRQRYGSTWRPAAQGPRWFIWLVACSTLLPAAARAASSGQAQGQQGGEQQPAAGGDSSGSGSGSHVGSAGDGQKYLAYIMKLEEGEAATWQLAGPDADRRGRQPPPRALPLEVSAAAATAAAAAGGCAVHASDERWLAFSAQPCLASP